MRMPGSNWLFFYVRRSSNRAHREIKTQRKSRLQIRDTGKNRTSFFLWALMNSMYA